MDTIKHRELLERINDATHLLRQARESTYSNTTPVIDAVEKLAEVLKNVLVDIGPSHHAADVQRELAPSRGGCWTRIRKSDGLTYTCLKDAGHEGECFPELSVEPDPRD